MTQQRSEHEVAGVVDLLDHYRFDCDRYNADTLVVYWCMDYPLNWVRLAVVEALYQGRYKSLSVEQILQGWQRRNQPTYHFNHEFERLIYSQLPMKPTDTQPPSQTPRVIPILGMENIAPNPSKLQSQSLESSRYTTAKHPIDQFIPDAGVDVEEIYRKVKPPATIDPNPPDVSPPDTNLKNE